MSSVNGRAANITDTTLSSAQRKLPTWQTPVNSMSQFVSSFPSRIAPACKVSPTSRCPAGKFHNPKTCSLDSCTRIQRLVLWILVQEDICYLFLLPIQLQYACYFSFVSLFNFSLMSGCSCSISFNLAEISVSAISSVRFKTGTSRFVWKKS